MAHLNVLIYVDDDYFWYFGDNHECIQNLFVYVFSHERLRSFEIFWVLRLQGIQREFIFSQMKYVLDIITESGLLGAKPASFLMEQHHRLALSTSPLLANPEQYRRMVGLLIYLAVTRPDLVYSVHTLAQFMQSPREEHWTAVLRVVRYLKNSHGQGILLRADNNFQI